MNRAESAATNFVAWLARALLLAETACPVALLATGIDGAGLLDEYDLRDRDDGNNGDCAATAGLTGQRVPP